MTAMTWAELIGLPLSPMVWLYQTFTSSDQAAWHWAGNVQAALLAVLVALLALFASATYVIIELLRDARRVRVPVVASKAAQPPQVSQTVEISPDLGG